MDSLQNGREVTAIYMLQTGDGRGKLEKNHTNQTPRAELGRMLSGSV